jgi:uncharacterized protein (TIGR03437 family)
MNWASRIALGVCFVAAALAQPPGGSGDGIWVRNAYFGEAQTFDSCVGHQPGNGQYHHHASPTCLRAQLNDNLELVRQTRNGAVYREKPSKHSPILGWAFDGLPVYGPYGYSVANDPRSAVRRMRSSFRLRSITARTSLPDWILPNHPGVPQQLSANQYGPAITAEFPLGRYLEDFEYVAGLGDLDMYNSRFAVTPEFPNGTWAYFVTIEDDGTPAFPYILGMQYRGAVTGGTARTVPAEAQDATGTVPSLASWIRNTTEPARVVTAFDPAAGAQTTWPPTNLPAGARTSGGVTSATPADTQRVRATDAMVYINSTGLARYTMGPWFDPLQGGGVFGNLPSNSNYQFQVPRSPADAASKTATGLGPVGVWVNGVAVFNVLDGASYRNATNADVGGGIVGRTATLASSASFERGPVTPGALLTAVPLFGTTIATTSASADSPNWPLTLGGTTISVRDAAGVDRAAQISYVSPGQVNFRLPEGLAVGFGTVTISAGGQTSNSGIQVIPSYPHISILNGDALAAAYVQRIRNGQVSVEQAVQLSGNDYVAAPIDLGAEGDDVYLILFGSGLGNATGVTTTIGGADATVLYAGPQGTYPGLDQYNVRIPRSLAGKGRVEVVISAAGRRSNSVFVSIR